MTVKAAIRRQTATKNHPNSVAFCVDDNYLPYALFVANQLLKVETFPIDICICLPSIDNIPPAFQNTAIRFVEIDIEGIDNLPTDHLSLAAYYRLFLPELFASDYDHIIYLDADVYIRRPFLHSLFNVIKGFNQDFSVAAAPYMGEVELITFGKLNHTKIQRYLERYHKLGHLYRNSGVLVFNVTLFNQQDILNKILTTTIQYPDHLESHDQSALNLTLLDKLALLPLSYNWQLNQFSQTIIDDINPHIVHFVNINKPWAIRHDYLTPYIAEYVDFLNLHFPDLNVNPLTYDQKRKENPKYKGIKEAISSGWFQFKSRQRQTQLNQQYQSNKPKILDAVSQVEKGHFYQQN